ncbi:MAG: hypothetical protein EAX86_11950 [Candidatus Heimdallarchaeota archaeon]|nr:hypothetical protein [Candidatus Heimdallarchaeota archaeon]
MAKTYTNMFTHEELPPLPERAIQGVPKDWLPQMGYPFHTVHIWEFPLLYVVLRQNAWSKISVFLRNHHNLAALARWLKLSHSTVCNIRDNPRQSISVPTLKKLCRTVNLDPTGIEASVKAVRFNMSGELEYIQFPFQMDISAWRALCHISGDGNVHKKGRAYPDLRWTQLRSKKEIFRFDLPPKTQCYMRALLEKLSRRPYGKGNNVNYPKALSYALIGAIPTLILDDLRTPKFIQFIIDLPMEFKDYKVQFLAAFALDDAGVNHVINYFQSSSEKLKLVQQLCNQLNYKNPNELYFHKRDKVWSFRLLSEGIQSFDKDLRKICDDSISNFYLGLWSKRRKIREIVNNVSNERLESNKLATQVNIQLLSIMSDHKIRSTLELNNHPSIKPLIQPLYHKSTETGAKLFKDRIRSLQKLRLFIEVKPNGKSKRPKFWKMPEKYSFTQAQEIFLANFGKRNHKQSYKRKDITTDVAITAIYQCIAQNIELTPSNVAKEGGFSRQVFYRRSDLKLLLQKHQQLQKKKNRI